MKRLRETSNWNIACPYYVYEIGVAWPFSKKGCFASTPDTFFVAHLQKLGRGTKMGNGTEWQAHYDHFCLKIKILQMFHLQFSKRFFLSDSWLSNDVSMVSKFNWENIQNC